MYCITYPKKLKRQRERQRYSEQKDEINKRRREAYRQKKIAAAQNSGLDNVTHTTPALSNGKDAQRLHVWLTCIAKMIYVSSVQDIMR